MANVGGVSYVPKDISVSRNTQFRLRRVNNYVEGMQYNCEVGADGEMRVPLGQPGAATSDYVVADVQLTASQAFSAVIAGFQVDAPYGRVLQIVASGANTRSTTVKGWDYLGQPMTETIVFNGSTPVDGKKAFFFIESWDIATGGDSTTVRMGTANKFGLPFYTTALVRTQIDNAPGADGTLTAGVLVAQTATSSDPRGYWAPAGGDVPDGSKGYVLTVIVAAPGKEDETGKFGHPVIKQGLHGIRHFAA